MKQSLIQIFVALLVFILIIFGILNNAIKDGRFVCNRYILNTYLYVILAFNIIAIQMLLMDYNNITFRPSFMLFIGIFIITIACIFIMHSITPDKLILKHCVWLIFMLLLGLNFIFMGSRIINVAHRWYYTRIIIFSIFTKKCQQFNVFENDVLLLYRCIYGIYYV